MLKDDVADKQVGVRADARSTNDRLAMPARNNTSNSSAYRLRRTRSQREHFAGSSDDDDVEDGDDDDEDDSVDIAELVSTGFAPRRKGCVVDIRSSSDAPPPALTNRLAASLGMSAQSTLSLSLSDNSTRMQTSITSARSHSVVRHPRAGSVKVIIIPSLQDQGEDEDRPAEFEKIDVTASATGAAAGEKGVAAPKEEEERVADDINDLVPGSILRPLAALQKRRRQGIVKPFGECGGTPAAPMSPQSVAGTAGVSASVPSLPPNEAPLIFDGHVRPLPAASKKKRALDRNRKPTLRGSIGKQQVAEHEKLDLPRHHNDSPARVLRHATHSEKDAATQQQQEQQQRSVQSLLNSTPNSTDPHRRGNEGGSKDRALPPVFVVPPPPPPLSCKHINNMPPVKTNSSVMNRLDAWRTQNHARRDVHTDDWMTALRPSSKLILPSLNVSMTQQTPPPSNAGNRRS